MIKIVNNYPVTDAVSFALDNLNKAVGDNQINADVTLILDIDLNIKPQGYQRKLTGETITISGADEAGLMYGLLDLAQEVKHGTKLDRISETEVVPFIENRGIKFNIPLDARTPSYSDASDSASLNIENMWDFSFWTEFLDRMALSRYNVLSLWTLSPFPSLVRIPEYPLTALSDVKRTTRPIKADLSGWEMYTEDISESLITVKKMTIDEKIGFWRSVMEYAKNRCVKIFIFTWNLFVYGTEQSPYGITCDQKNPITKDYIYCGTKALMDTYPLLAGIGITSGEHMLRDDTDIPFLSESYGRGVRDYLKEHPDREFKFIHRMQYTRYDSIINEFRQFPCPFEISFKYSQAHMYSDAKPAFIDTFLKEKAKDIKIWLTVRNDDFYMYRWGDPEYARDYIRQMPVNVMSGYYMGADGFTWGRDYMDERDSSHQQFIAKMWYMFMMWGQLSYNVKLPNEYFINELGRHFELNNTQGSPKTASDSLPGKAYSSDSNCAVSASLLYDTWKQASMIIPEFNCVHWHDFDFQWYPEGCCMYIYETDKLLFADINEFVNCKSIPGGAYYSVSEYCEAVNNGRELDRKDPLSMAASIIKHADAAIEGIRKLREISGLNGEELVYTLEDIEALGLLGYYYGTKLCAAVSLCMYRLNGDTSQKNEAVELLKKAAGLWKQYSSKSRAMYKPQVLTRLCGLVDVQHFDELAELDILLAAE